MPSPVVTRTSRSDDPAMFEHVEQVALQLFAIRFIDAFASSPPAKAVDSFGARPNILYICAFPLDAPARKVQRPDAYTRRFGQRGEALVEGACGLHPLHASP